MLGIEAFSWLRESHSTATLVCRVLWDFSLKNGLKLLAAIKEKYECILRQILFPVFVLLFGSY